MLFRGRFLRNIDRKGRIILPQEFRTIFSSLMKERKEIDNPSGLELPSDFVLTTYDNCLVAFAWHNWIELEKKFMSLPNPSTKARAFRRLVIGGAEQQTFDAQGRILLSQDHRDYAGISEEAIVLGMIDRFEIWNPELLKTSMSSDNLNGVTEELAESGIVFSL